MAKRKKTAKKTARRTTAKATRASGGAGTKASKADVWAVEIADQPGGLARVLEALAEAGVTIECCIARRQADRPGEGVVFVSPVTGARAQEAARSAGLSPASDLATLRVEGADTKGAGAALTRAIAGAGINLRGLSAAVIGNRYVAYFGFDNPADVARAAEAIKSSGRGGRR
jgi:hypothetical protein